MPQPRVDALPAACVAKLITWATRGRALDDHSARMGGDVDESVVVTGDGNTVTTEFRQVTLPPAESVDLAAPEARGVVAALDQAAKEAAS